MLPFAVPAALSRIPWKLVGVGLLVLALVVQTLRLNASQERAERYKAKAESAIAARAADRRIYEQAQSDAQAKNRSQVERIKTEQEKISAEQKSKYDRDLARLRAGGLRKDLAAPPGVAGCPATSADAKPAAGADDPIVCIPRSVLMRAAEIELGRNTLIDWVNAQLGVVR